MSPRMFVLMLCGCLLAATMVMASDTATPPTETPAEPEFRESNDEAFEALQALQAELDTVSAQGDPQALQAFETKCLEFAGKNQQYAESFQAYLLVCRTLVDQRKWGRLIEVGEPLLKQYNSGEQNFDKLYLMLGMACQNKKRLEDAERYFALAIETTNSAQVKYDAGYLYAQITVQAGRKAPDLYVVDNKSNEFDMAVDGKGKVIAFDIYGPW